MEFYTLIINCKEEATRIERQIAETITLFNFHPTLAVITTDQADDASKVYMRNKKRAAERVGINYREFIISAPSHLIESTIISKIQELNADEDIHGIIVQLPLPKKVNVKRVQFEIDPTKDVDGFHPDSAFIPCTPHAVFNLMHDLKMPIEGSNCVVIGRSDIVGRPLAKILLNSNATVSVCHSHTSSYQLAHLCKNADYIFCAAGVPDLIKPNYLTPGLTTAFDISINRDKNNKLCGDIAPECYPILKAYTPVPGGIGPLTVATLMHHTMIAKATMPKGEIIA